MKWSISQRSIQSFTVFTDKKKSYSPGLLRVIRQNMMYVGTKIQSATLYRRFNYFAIGTRKKKKKKNHADIKYARSLEVKSRVVPLRNLRISTQTVKRTRTYCYKGTRTHRHAKKVRTHPRACTHTHTQAQVSKRTIVLFRLC